MELSDHLQTIVRHWWRILLASIVIAALVFVWRDSAPREYSSTALLRVVVQDAEGSASEESVDFVGRSFGLLAETRPVLADAAERAGGGDSTDDLDAAISVDASTPGYLSLSATADTPERAATRARAAAAALTDAVREQERQQQADILEPLEAQQDAIEDQLATLDPDDPQQDVLQTQYQALVQSTLDASLQPVDRVDLVAPPRESSTPIAPRPRRDATLAFVLALVVNAELIVLLTALSDRFPRDDLAAAVREATGLPVLGEVPDSDEAGAAEALRSVRTNLIFMESLDPLRSIAVVGGEAGCGKSFVAVNLALSLTELDLPVRLVDCDLRHPTLHTYLGVPRSPGLTDVLQRAQGEPVARDVPGRPLLSFAPAGSDIVPDPAAIFATDTFKRTVLSPEAGSLVIVDTPPLGLFADALAIAGQTSGVILVVDATRSRRRRVKRVLRLLEQLGVRPLGVVLNRTKAQRIRGYYKNLPAADAATTSGAELATPGRDR